MYLVAKSVLIVNTIVFVQKHSVPFAHLRVSSQAGFLAGTLQL